MNTTDRVKHVDQISLTISLLKNVKSSIALIKDNANYRFNY